MRSIFRRTAVAFAACAAMVGGVLMNTAEAEAVQKPQPFPYMYSNVKLPAMTFNGAPSPLNDTIWPHMTVFTHSQSLLIMNNRNGVLAVVGQSRTAPYAAMSNSARNALRSPDLVRNVLRGGCLATYWQNNDINVPGYGWIGAYTHGIKPEYCYR